MEKRKKFCLDVVHHHITIDNVASEYLIESPSFSIAILFFSNSNKSQMAALAGAPEKPKSVLDQMIFGGGSSLAFDRPDPTGTSADSKAAQDQVRAETSHTSIVHVRIQQRNGRKCLTTIQGLAPDLDKKKILRAMKKTFSTNGTILKDDVLGKILQLQGDQRARVEQFLLKCKIIDKKSDIKVHGF
jgi:translation initiation factor 1